MGHILILQLRGRPISVRGIKLIHLIETSVSGSSDPARCISRAAPGFLINGRELGAIFTHTGFFGTSFGSEFQFFELILIDGPMVCSLADSLRVSTKIVCLYPLGWMLLSCLCRSTVQHASLLVGQSRFRGQMYSHMKHCFNTNHHQSRLMIHFRNQNQNQRGPSVTKP